MRVLEIETLRFRANMVPYGSSQYFFLQEKIAFLVREWRKTNNLKAVK